MNGADRVQLVETGMSAYSRGDMPAVLDLLDDDVEIYSPTELGNPASSRGHEGYLEWVAAWLEAWQDYSVEITRIEAVGDRHVVAACHQQATGRESGVTVEFPVAYMWEIPDSRATAFHLYRTWDEAIQVAQGREADD